MIYIKNTQKTVPVDTAWLKKQLAQIMQILKYDDFTVSLLVTTDATIRKYNKQFRAIDKPTDILSFPYEHTHDDKNLGDLIISAPYACNDAQKLGLPFEYHLQKLLVHGVCHLLGYDHITDADWRSMRAKEAFVMRKLLNGNKPSQNGV